MKPALVRFGVYSLVALALVGALHFTPALPDPDAKAADVLATQAATPSWKLHFDTLESGESLQALLTRGGLSQDDASQAVTAATASVNERHIPAGMPVTIKSAPTDSVPSEITLQLSGTRLLHLRRAGDAWTGTEDTIPATTDTIVVHGTIAPKSNLTRAVNASVGDALPEAARIALTWNLADVYAYRIDMSHELQVGDAFTVAAERLTDAAGGVHIGNIIGATFSVSGKVIDAIRFTPRDSGEYFDQFGKSMRTAFLRLPVKFRYISSSFGLRLHPILGIMREHKGTDYAAAVGTPIQSVGDGVVTRAGWAGGYGNLVEIRHTNGIVTRYGHMRAFAAHIHAGSRVTAGQTIGYVGATGLATGPHLHFEVLVNGQQRNPQTALKSIASSPLPASDLPAFQQLATRLLASLNAPDTGVTKLTLP